MADIISIGNVLYNRRYSTGTFKDPSPSLTIRQTLQLLYAVAIDVSEQ